MKELSSDTLFYRGLIGLIVGPFVLLIFIRFFWAKSFSSTAMIISYIGLVLFTLFQWYKIFKYKKILYSNQAVSIRSYFFKTSIEVPFSQVVNIKKKFTFGSKASRLSYKITFHYNGKTHSAYFFKALRLYNVDDLADYIGIS
jgi:hypothetical protein